MTNDKTNLERVNDVLKAAHETSALGRQLETATSPIFVDGGNPAAVVEVINFILTDLHALEAVVRHLAAELDGLSSR